MWGPINPPEGFEHSLEMVDHFLILGIRRLVANTMMIVCHPNFFFFPAVGVCDGL
jgi:hypothetical protein